MRVVQSLLLVGALVPLWLTSAEGSPHEGYVGSGGTVLQSGVQTLGGAGGGLGYRYHLSDVLAAQVESYYLLGLGNAYALSLGMTAQRPGASWRPSAGLHLTTFLGDRVRFVNSSMPQPAAGVPVALMLRLAPIRFASGKSTTSIFTFGIGLGLDESGTSTAYSLALLEIGWRSE